MDIESIKEVLNFSAFKPAPYDSSATWLSRFSGKKTLIFHVNKDKVQWRVFNKNGSLSSIDEAEGDFPSLMDTHASEFRKMSDSNWCVVSLNSKYMITLEKNLSRRSGYETILRNDPKSIIGAKYDRSKRYSLCHNPLISSSLLLSLDESLILEIEESLTNAGYRAGRICVGLYGMMSNTILKIHKNAKKIGNNACLITCCHDSVSIMVKKDNQWSDVRCRSGVYKGDINSVLPILSPIVQKLGENVPVFIVGDNPQGELQQSILNQFAELGARDVSQPDYMWKVISDLDKV